MTKVSSILVANGTGEERIDKRHFKEERTHLSYLLSMGGGKERGKRSGLSTLSV